MSFFPVFQHCNRFLVLCVFFFHLIRFGEGNGDVRTQYIVLKVRSISVVCDFLCILWCPPLPPATHCCVLHGVRGGTWRQSRTRDILPQLLAPTSWGAPSIPNGLCCAAQKVFTLFLQPDLAYLTLLIDNFLPLSVGSARLCMMSQGSVVSVRKGQKCGCPVLPTCSSPWYF